MIRDDDELGRLRRCPVCEEWLPDDAEFWNAHKGMSRCRFCWGEYQRTWQDARREIRVLLGPAPCSRCGMHLQYSTAASQPDTAPRWREPSTNRIHVCAVAA